MILTSSMFAPFVPGAPRGDPGLQQPERHQPVHPGGSVPVQHHLLSGRFLLLLHHPRGAQHQEQPQDVHQPKEGHRQLFRGVSAGQRRFSPREFVLYTASACFTDVELKDRLCCFHLLRRHALRIRCGNETDCNATVYELQPQCWE